MNRFLLSATIGFFLVTGANAQDVTCGNASNVVTFSFTGAMQTFTVPTPSPGTTLSNIHIEAYGAQGADGATGGQSTLGGTGGLGGFAEGDLTAAAGTVLNIFVGGAGSGATGGFNGGGTGGSSSAGGGGGASDIRIGGVNVSDRVAVAGGGGGGGRAGCETQQAGVGGNGGAGGSATPIGLNGGDSPTSGGVAGGGQGGNGIFGGANGAGCGGFLGSSGTDADTLTGTGGNGGAGQSCCCFSFGSIPGGGGGGGGVSPGGGGGGGSAGTTGCSGNDKGAGGGGAGGTSAMTGFNNQNFSEGVRSGDGLVRVCYSEIAPTPTPTPSATVAPNSRYTLLSPAVGSSPISAPTITVLNESTLGVNLRTCFNFRELQPRTANVFGILKLKNGRTILKRRLLRTARCMNAVVNTPGDYELFFLQERFKQKRIRSKIAEFRISPDIG